ncbi:GNAT family N-acetyltransferase [Staphylococcus saprophyticus]|uniref:GNAT family N-acetyltransferase n=1 Tax=Staphylococcus saprophyticus TaxID=29385 RepID=UPI0010114C6D|nr:GNAT family protein [Staphylococcus saprophyticus]MDW4386067.1 GNAT family protein [Staphylococcus saprophyticus]RXS20215.1 N-acetyltransferase [Staphylococcus saprophyticus]
MERIINIRPIEYDDLELLHKWRNDREIFSQLGDGFFPVSKTEMSNWMSNFCKNDKSNLKFIITYDSKGAGYITLTNVNYINRSAELGIYIGEKNLQGCGIASGAIELLEDFATNNLNLRKIKLLVNSDNNAALALYHKLGFRDIGIYEKERFIKGNWVDVKIMEKFIIGK